MARRRARKILDAVGFCLFVPVGLIWIGCDEVYGFVKEEVKTQKKHYDAKKAYRVRQSLAPPASAPPKRTIPRILKPPKETKLVEIQLEKPQLQSALLRLPGEIRNLIYEYTLGGNTFHIINSQKSLSHIACRTPFEGQPTKWCEEAHDADIHRSCVPLGYTCDTAYQCPQKMQKLATYATNSGGLILTCRQIYLEASDYLYSKNMFDFNSLDSFRYLRDSANPRHFSLIKHLQISHYFKAYEQFVPDRKRRHREDKLYAPYDNATWKNTWRIVAEEMVGLKDLRFRPVADRCLRSSAVWRLMLLEEIRQVRGLDYFHLWSEDALAKRSYDYPEWEEDVNTAIKTLYELVRIPRWPSEKEENGPEVKEVANEADRSG